MAASGNSGGSVGNLKPWKPGQSGNPSGRPKGIAARVRESVTPDQIVAGLLEIATGAKSDRDRLGAWRELADRGWGKAPAFALVEGADPLELDAVAVEISKLQAHVDALREAKQAA